MTNKKKIRITLNAPVVIGTVQDNISNMAHIVGGMIGGVLGYVLNKKATEA